MKRKMKNFVKKITPPFLLNQYHFLLAFLGSVLYRFPSKKLRVIGVTGTKGKTTVVYLAGKILEEAGFKVGWISSATLKIGEKEWLNPYHMTMPGRFLIQKFLREMVNAGCQYALIEVTSEGIKQFRHKFIDFNTAAFTNLAPEHIEAHKGFEKYRAAKGELFQVTKGIHIINLDDENTEYFLQFPSQKKFGYSINDNLKIESLKINWKLKMENWKFIKVSDVNVSSVGINFKVENTSFHLNLLAGFNVYNSLAAICIGLSQGISLDVCKKALEKIKYIPGRMEFINEGQNFVVIVDLAHTPDSFEKVFKLVNEMPHNRIISVFGAAGGGRDKWKRPELGKIAAHYSDYIILTNEDSYNENPSQILSEIKSGIINSQFPIRNLYEIIDRREAIRKSLSLAKEKDIVLILGKGTEQTIVIGSEKILWDDREVAREEIKNLTKI
jgi:UDP-N-acetylmuramoyl-L-alanyl-D-glutamate--2,6-diaminopimelate ligase